jgi:hypothetical protein
VGIADLNYDNVHPNLDRTKDPKMSIRNFNAASSPSVVGRRRPTSWRADRRKRDYRPNDLPEPAVKAPSLQRRISLDFGSGKTVTFFAEQVIWTKSQAIAREGAGTEKGTSLFQSWSAFESSPW